jgi:hypothetical protein
MYCTLQEAYNIPSFTNKKKKGCTAPLSGPNSGTPPLGKISADSYDPFDPYTAESGKERALALNGPESAPPRNGVPTTRLQPPLDPQYANGYAAAQCQSQMSSYMENDRKEAAMNNNLNPIWPTRFNSQPKSQSQSQSQSQTQIQNIENFEQYGKMPPVEQTWNDIPYNVQAGDYKYYCDSFGICTTPQVGVDSNGSGYNNTTRAGNNTSSTLYSQSSSPSQNNIEGFANPQQSVPSSNRYPSAPQRQSPAIMLSQNGPPTAGTPGDIKTPYYGPTPMGSCGSIQAPAYELPISNENKAQFQKIMESAIDQQQGATENIPYPMRRVNMSNVSGYYDEELESFLTTQELRNRTLPPAQNQRLMQMSQSPTPSQIPSQTPSQTPSQIPPLVTSSESVVSVPVKTTYMDSQQYIMDLLLFIALGILIILLCDQIFKLGMSFGMRDTVEILMPYLKDIKINEA